MENNVKTQIKELASLVNTYAKNKDPKVWTEVSTSTARFFDAQTVTFWHVDSENEMLKRADTDQETTLFLDTSLVQHAIKSKEISIENHVNSNKYYHQAIDNPLEIKIKALMILPMIKGKNVFGIVKILRGTHQRKVFTKNDEKALHAFAPIFLKMFKSESISKEDLLQVLGVDTGNKREKEEKTVIMAKKSVVKPSDDGEAFTKLEKEIAILREENKIYQEKEKAQSKVQEKERISHKKSIETLVSTREELKKKEYTLLEINNEFRILEKSKKELKKDLELIQKENIELQKTTREQNTTIRNMKEFKPMSQSKTGSIASNVEFILQHVDSRFAENEHGYMLFELITYALSSKKSMAHIEEVLEKSKLIPKIMDGYHFKTSVQEHDEKYRISDMVKHIEGYEKNIFSKMEKFNITVDELMPSLLFFDAPKIQSIIFHLLLDLYQFVDHNQNVDIHFSFKKKFLHIEIGGTVYRKDGLLKKMFKQSKFEEEKNRIGLQLSKKMITRLKGKIDTVQKDAYCQFVVNAPANIIRM